MTVHSSQVSALSSQPDPELTADGCSLKAARPFVKWAGGKGQLLEQLRPLLPLTFGRYYEPFVGGGAFFFDLAPAFATLADSSWELVNAYRVVRDAPEVLLNLLEGLAAGHAANPKEHYYEVRANPCSSDEEAAARFMYLNRTCFNGLYRVNRKGQFNVPLGRYTNPRIVDRDNVLACSVVLGAANIHSQDFEVAVDSARPGDFVYFDPPYDVISKTACFTSYNVKPFDWSEQERLRRVFEKLASRGVKCMLSNADTPRIRELYRGFPITAVSARRAINSAAAKRGAVSEVVVTSGLAPSEG